MLAELSEPSSLTHAAATGTRAVASTDYAVEVFTAAIITLARLPIHPAVPRRVAGTFATFTFTPSGAGQIGAPLALLDALLSRQWAGTWVLTLLPIPAYFAVTSSTVTLSMT